MGRRLLAMDRRARRNHNAETALNRLLAVDFYLELDEGLPEEFGSASGGQRRRLPMQAKQAVYRIQCRSSSVDCIVPFRRKYLKGLLSIPSNGRGARRPLGQSFHESVGPSALPAEKHDKCAAELFHKFKSVAPELVAKLLKSMGLNLETWRSWDDYYGQNS